MDIQIPEIQAKKILAEYSGANNYILNLKSYYNTYKSKNLTRSQSDYIITNENKTPKIARKWVEIDDYFSDTLMTKHLLTKRPEKIWVEKILTDSEKAFHIWGKIVESQNLFDFWVPKNQIIPRANPDIDGGEINNMALTGINTQQRVEQWSVGHPVGYAVNKLHQCFLDQTANNFFFIRYEDLCSNPESVMKGIYSFLEIDQFEHNFKDIPQITVEDDTIHGIYGDHTIRNTLGMLPDDSKQILGEFTCDWIYNNFKWYFDIFKYNK